MCFIALRARYSKAPSFPRACSSSRPRAASRTENLHPALSRESEACVWTQRHRRGAGTLSVSSRGVALDTHCHRMKVLPTLALT